MDLFQSAPHHDVLAVLIQITVLLFTARIFSEIAQRLGQPSVLGEILAGIILGPSLLSGLAPALGYWIIPHNEVQGHLLEMVSLIGAIFLLLITGLETDLPLIRRHAGSAISAAAGGLVIPFATGLVLGYFIPSFLLVNEDSRLVFALFLAAAMSISAIPVIAKVLIDLNLMRRDIGQAIIAAGMVDDTVAWVLLSIILGLATSGAVTAGSVAYSVGSIVGFLLLSFTVGRWLVKRVLDLVQDELITENRLITLVAGLAFAWGAITQAIDLEAVFGVFVMGILFGQMPRLPKSVIHSLETMTFSIFSPIFFAVAGLKVNLWNLLLNPTLLGVALVVFLVACFGKIVGSYAGARWLGGQDHWTAMSFGAALNARGAMQIVIASIGLSLNIITQDMFSIIILMAIGTSLIAPPLLRWSLKNMTPSAEEMARLKREELAKGSPVAHIHRVLLPVRRRTSAKAAVQTIEAQLLQRMGNTLSLTLLNIATDGNREAGTTYLNQLATTFAQQELLKKVLVNNKPVDVIIDEAKKDYDLLVLGASEEHSKNPDVVFTPFVDYLVRLAPCPTMVVHGQRLQPNWQPRRVLVPTNGSTAAKHAAELALALTSAEEEIHILHVVAPNPFLTSGTEREEGLQEQINRGYQMVKPLQTLGEAQQRPVQVKVLVGRPETAIIEYAKEQEIDLIILGTDVRAGTDRLFLGSRVERILQNTPCPVVVFNS